MAVDNKSHAIIGGVLVGLGYFLQGRKGFDAESFASDTEVGNTIYRQLGGNRFRMMAGAKDMVWDGDNKSLQMKIGRNSLGANYLIITLNANDLYDMRFESRRWNRKTYDLNIKVKGEYNGLYAEQLQSVFTEATGLYTRMAESFNAEGDGNSVDFSEYASSGISGFPKLMKKGEYGVLENYWSRDWREDGGEGAMGDLFSLTCVWNDDYTNCSFVKHRGDGYTGGDNYKNNLAADMQLMVTYDKSDNLRLYYGWGQFNTQFANVEGVKEVWANDEENDVSDWDESVKENEVWMTHADANEVYTQTVVASSKDMINIEKSYEKAMKEIGFDSGWMAPFAQFLHEFYWGFSDFEPQSCTEHKWSDAYVRDTEYDDDETGSVTFGQDCTLCGEQRRGSIGGDVSWDMAAESFGAESYCLM